MLMAVFLKKTVCRYKIYMHIVGFYVLCLLY